MLPTGLEVPQHMSSFWAIRDDALTLPVSRACSVVYAALVLSLVLPAATAQAQVSVVFEADMRAAIAANRFDPARDTVGVRGGVPPLSWQRSIPMQPVGDGRYVAKVRFDAPPYGGQPVPHKFRIDRPGQGADDGWEPGRNHAAMLDNEAPRIARVFGASVAPPPPRRTGTIVTVETGPARHAPSRPVWVWLPPGYEVAASLRYPVLYLLDGQNVFEAADAGAEWQVDETAQRMVIADEVSPMIIVAVPSGRDRIHEYTPTAGLMDAARRGRDGPPQRVGGGGPSFARYLLEDLKPAIDQRFRTRPEAAATAVGGSSLGGLLALWMALHESDRVGAALVVSPSVWWDERFAEHDARQAPHPRGCRPRLWLDVGGQEGEGAADAVRSLRDALRTRGWSEASMAYTEVSDGRHDELSWAARVPGMLRFLYGKPSTHCTEPAP